MAGKKQPGSKVPPALKRYHITHPNAKNSHKSYGPNKSKVQPKGKGK